MKLTLKLFLILVAVLAALLLSVQVLINRRLAPAMQKALPEISRQAGFDIGIDDVSLNLFMGCANADGLDIRIPDSTAIPPVLSIKRTSVDLGWTRLFQKIIYISDISVEKAVFTVVRTSDGSIRLPALTSLGSTTEMTNPPPIEVSQEPTTNLELPGAVPTARLPKIALKQARISTSAVYEDRSVKDTAPLRVVLDLTLSAEDLYTYGDLPSADWGEIRLLGRSTSHPGTLNTDIFIRTAPVMNPATASFTVDGNVLNINLKDLGDLLKELEVTSESADMALQLSIIEGVFQEGSSVTLTLRHAELAGKLKEKHKRVVLPETLTLEIPIKGTLESPQINVPQAVTHSVLKLLADNPEYILDQITIDGKSLRDRLKKSKRD